MNDDRFDEFVQDAARQYNAPGETPREEIWARIEAARTRVTPIVDLGARRRRKWLVLGVPLAVAATLLVGVAIGRMLPGTSDPSTSTTIATAPPSESASVAFQLAAAEHLSRVDALLVEYGSGHAGGGADVQALARDLLSRTRLWIDADRVADPRLRSLLEDLELVLVQIVQLAPAASAAERSIVDHGISQLEIRSRLRNAIPAGPTA
jgi:hypothetical protein